MGVLPVRDRLGTKFTVTGAWFHDGHEARKDRVSGGKFMMTVNATSTEDAVAQVSAMIGKDIVVHQVSLG